MARTAQSRYTMTCCLRALLEDLSFTKRSLPIGSTRSIYPQSFQTRAFSTSLIRQQDLTNAYGGEEEGINDAKSLTAQSKRQRLESQQRGRSETDLKLPEGSRFVPASASYFTGNAAFFDNWLTLQDLLYKYQTLPTVDPADAPRATWRPLADFRSFVGGNVQAAKYKKIQNILTRLNRIDPALMPEDVKTAIEIYKRPEAAEHLQARPKVIDYYGRARGSGRRKEASAMAWVVEGDGGVFVNGKPLLEAFPRLHDRESVIWPLKATNRVNRYNIWAQTQGGGITGQAESITLAVTRALLVHEPLLKPVLRRAGCVTRDPRTVERKKHGKVKARKMPAWVAR